MVNRFTSSPLNWFYNGQQNVPGQWTVSGTMTSYHYDESSILTAIGLKSPPSTGYVKPGRKNATKVFDQLHKKPQGGDMAGSNLLKALMGEVKGATSPRNTRPKHLRNSNIPSPKATTMTEEIKAVVDPFILEHRVGTTERITHMDPMSADFVRSLRIKLNGKYSNKIATTWGATPKEVFQNILHHKPSKLLKDLVPHLANIADFHMSDLGRPWDKDGWVNPSFDITTGCVIPVAGRSLTFDSARMVLDPWLYRKPGAQASGPAKVETYATLVNKFDAIPDRLVCYSFIVEYGSLKQNQSLINIWLNREYIDAGARYLPMYFEEGGASTYLVNVASASAGFQTEGDGAVKLVLRGRAGKVEKTLNRDQLLYLLNQGILVNWGGIRMTGATPVASMWRLDLQHLGYTLNPGGTTWALSNVFDHLPWSVQMLRAGVMRNWTSLKRHSIVGGTVAASRAMFEKNADERKSIISKAICKEIWDTINANSTPFDSLLKELREEFIEAQVADEFQRLHGVQDPTEIDKIVDAADDSLGRFVFEVNLPVAVSVE